MRSSVNSDLSQDLSAIGRLSLDQQQRLTDLLDRYLQGLEAGRPLDPAEMAVAHPDLRDALQSYVVHLAALHQVAAGFATPEPTDNIVSQPTGAAVGDQRRLGDFVLEREIGRGGMGVVYEAHQISLDRRVAVKVLPFAAVLDAKQIARFKHEAQAAAQVQHPHIVPVFAVGVDRGVHYYAMQLIDGQPLDRAIRELRGESAADTGRPTENRTPGDSLAQTLDTAHVTANDRATVTSPRDPTCRSLTSTGAAVDTSRSWLTRRRHSPAEYLRTIGALGVQAAEALHAAHEYGVVHRDIKPSNLLVDQAGKLWITDFGLARCQTDSSLTRSGELLGTLRYMSPEQAAGRGAYVDQRTDVYSLGATLYELVTLHAAFPGDHQVELLQLIEAQDPVSPRHFCPNLPADLENVIVKAMAKSRDDRYATAQELADDLRRFLDGRPTEARPPTWLDQAGRWARRRRKLVATACGVGTILLIGLACSTVLVARAQLRADANWRRAEDNLEQARRAVEHFGLDLPEELAKVAGAEQIHRQFLLDALDYYQRFTAQEANDPTLQAEIALSHSRIGRLQERIGSRAEALDAHQTALRLLKQLQQDDPEQPEYQRQLGICQNNLGQLYSAMGDLAAAQQAFQEALAWQQPLANGEYDPVVCRADLARTENNLGLLLFQAGQQPQAIQWLQQAIQLQRRVTDVAAQDVEAWRQLGTYSSNLSGMLTETDPQAAAEWNRAALAAYQQVVQSQPHVVDNRYSLALTHVRLAAIQTQLRQFPDAVQSYQRARDGLSELQQAAPADRAYRIDLALVLNSLGSLHTQLGEFHAATACLRQARDWQQSLVDADPQDWDARSVLGGIHNNLGYALQSARQFDLAVAEFELAIQEQQMAFDARPDQDRLRVLLSNHMYNYAEVLRLAGRGQAAAEVALRRRKLWEHEPKRLLHVAEELALACATLAQEPLAPEVVTRYQNETLATLRQAADTGLRFSTLSDLPPALRGLAGVTEIRSLWADPVPANR